jgi:methionine-rich copper-binding protein CopC
MMLAQYSVVAEAHAHLLASTTAARSSSPSVPRELSMTFSEPVRLTPLSIESASLAVTKMAPLSKCAAANVTLSLPPLGAGR